MKRITVLGSTGSIGCQTLDVAENLGFKISVLAASKNAKAMERQLRKFRPETVVMYDESAARELKVRAGDMPVRILSGMDGLCEAARMDTDIVLTAVSGMVGLLPTMAAIEAGHEIALANKETLVAGGAVVTEAARRNNVRLLPVDSEHSAIFQCLQGAPAGRSLKSITLTASGGPFFGKTRGELVNITPALALKHPNWEMGPKITIDSATMMNKGLELIEAKWLFDVSPENINIVVHRESIVHSLIEYDDNSVLAQLGVPDMRIPIQYALTYPKRLASSVKRLDLTEIGNLSFYKPDSDTFGCPEICREACVRGGLYPAAVNAAGERAVELFLEGKIRFLDIEKLVAGALELDIPAADGTVEQIIEVDKMVRELQQ